MPAARRTVCSFLWVLGLTSGFFVAGRPATASDAPGVASSLRSSLEEALFYHRLRTLGCLLCREAYAANAQTLAQQPTKCAVAQVYQGLAEAELGEFETAAKFFADAEANLSADTLLRQVCLAWVEAIQAGRLPSMAENRDMAPWRCRMAAQLGVQTGKPALPNDPSRQDCLHYAVALSGRGGDLGWLRLVEKMAIEPAHRIWLDGIADKHRDVEYRFYDPALFTITAIEKAKRLGAATMAAEDLESQLITLWALLLGRDWTGAEKLLQRLERVAESRTGKPAQLVELDCLAAVAAVRQGRMDEYRKIIARLRLAEYVPLWGIRALSLLTDNPEAFRNMGEESPTLDVAHQAVNWLIGSYPALDGRLLSPRKRSQQHQSEMLRDVYWEVAYAYRCRAVRQKGLVIPPLPAADAVRGASVARALSAPHVRSRTKRPPMRTLLLADISTVTADVELWQSELTEELLADHPLLGPTRHLARVISGHLRTRSQGAPFQRYDEVFAEDVDSLLAGRGNMSEATGEKPNLLSVDEPTGASTSSRRLVRWAVAVALGVVIVLVVLAWCRRPRRGTGRAR